MAMSYSLITVVVVVVAVVALLAGVVVTRRKNGAATASSGSSAVGGGSIAGDEVAAAIALALELDGMPTVDGARGMVRPARAASAWTDKSYGMTRMPERKNRV